MLKSSMMDSSRQAPPVKARKDMSTPRSEGRNDNECSGTSFLRSSLFNRGVAWLASTSASIEGQLSDGHRPEKAVEVSGN
jgi:hypothetical protein